MKYPVLLLADLHLTSKEVDQYRWEIFNWIIEQIKQKEIKEVFILGDLTDSKDRHDSLLVNKLVGNLCRVSLFAPIKIIKGNHDYIDSDNPFMEFINNIPNIEFYSTWNHITVTVNKPTKRKILFLPHTRDYKTDWQIIDFNDYDYIFMHQTVKGSKAANGFVLEEGMNKNYFNKNVYSGDIHVPQIIGNVEYIGAPYPIRFGDNYEGRCLLLDLDNGRKKNLYFDTIKKDVLDITLKDGFNNYQYYSKGDMVKVRIHLKKYDFFKWQSVKNDIVKKLEKIGVIVSGVEIKEIKRVQLIEEGIKSIELKVLKDVFFSYVKKENIGNEYVEVGKDYL